MDGCKFFHTSDVILNVFLHIFTEIKKQNRESKKRTDKIEKKKKTTSELNHA